MHHLTLVHLIAHICAKTHFNIISDKSEKMKLKSGHLELRFSVYFTGLSPLAEPS